MEQWRKRLLFLGTPTLLLYDADGMLLRRWSSFMPPDVLVKELELALVK